MNDNTPAASGAAPADSFEAWLDEFDDPQFPELRRRDRFGERVIEDFRIGWDAALESREASTATLTEALKAVAAQGDAIARMLTEGKVQTSTDAQHQDWKRMQKTWDALIAQVAAALASPQVAPDPYNACQSFEMYQLVVRQNSSLLKQIEALEDQLAALATTVQVALQAEGQSPVAQVVAVDPPGPDGHGVNWLKGKRPKPGALLYAAPMQPGVAADDARDAARWRALPACAADHQIDLMGLYRDVDAFIATPAAKPAEEQGS